MYSVKPSGEIRLPRGDTAMFEVVMKGADFSDDAIALFAIRAGNRTVLSKELGIHDNSVIVYLSNQDTRDLVEGKYQWDIRIVTNPERDENGKIYCNDTSDSVTSIFSGRRCMPELIITEVAVDV